MSTFHPSIFSKIFYYNKKNFFALSIATVFVSSSSPSPISLSLMNFSCFSFYDGTLKRVLNVGPCTLKESITFVSIYMWLFFWGEQTLDFITFLKEPRTQKIMVRATALNSDVSRKQLLLSSSCFCCLLEGFYPFLWLQFIPTFQRPPNFYLQFSRFFWALGSYWQLSTRHLSLDLICLDQTHYLPDKPIHLDFFT